MSGRLGAALLFAATVGALAHWRFPLDQRDPYLRLVAIRSPRVYQGLTLVRGTLFFTTPFLAANVILAAGFVFGPRRLAAGRTGSLPPYSDPGEREELSLVLGEQHHPTRVAAAEEPSWIAMHERGLYCGLAILGAIGTGKTRSAIRPFAWQLFSYRSGDQARRPSGLILEVKGDLCHKVREDLVAVGRGDDYVEISLHGEWCYNPLNNDLDTYSQAYAIASILNNLYGRGKEPFWQQAYVNLLKFALLLHRLVDRYATLVDLYESCINPEKLRELLRRGDEILHRGDLVVVEQEVMDDPAIAKHLVPFGFAWDGERYSAQSSPQLAAVLEGQAVPFRIEERAGRFSAAERDEFAAVRRWFEHDWSRIETRLRTSIVEGISVFLSLFDADSQVKRIFCPPKEAYDPSLNTPDAQGVYKYGRPLPPFGELIEQGKVVAVNFPSAMNPGLARAIGVLLKLDYQRATLLRIPKMADTQRHFRPTIFVCDEYHAFATCGEGDPTGDEKWLSLSRQARVVPIVATQSVASLKSALHGDSYHTLLQCFGTTLALRTKDDLTARYLAELSGKEDKPFISYNLSENAGDARVSLLSGRTVGHKGSVTTSKSYTHRLLPRFDEKAFFQLQDSQAIVMGYDGREPIAPTLCYLKPFDLDPQLTWFEQKRRHLL